MNLEQITPNVKCTICTGYNSKRSLTSNTPELVDLDGRIDLSDEEESRVETDGAGQDPEGDYYDPGVSKVEQGGNELVDVQLRKEVKYAVGKHVKR